MDIKKRIIGILLFIFLSALPQNAYSAVLINEILANGLSDPEYEWIELFNNGSTSVNLTNWNVSESSSGNFTLNTTISPNEFIILAVDFDTFNSTYPNLNISGIRIIDITISNFNLADSSGEVKLYNSSGALVDSIAYVQASGKSFENISIGRYPDGSSGIFNISTLTPGAKNDNQNPRLNKWVNPSRNNTNISGLTTLIVNLTDDTTQVNSSLITFNGTNFSMSKNGDLWAFLWNTSLNIQKHYNITIFFNDSYGKSGSDRLLNIFVNNSPKIGSFSPTILAQTLAENSILNFNVNASDPDDAISFSWYIDGILNSTSQNNFSYAPGFSDNGTHAINVTVRDSANQASIKWTVTVTNVNRAPVLDSIPGKSFSKNINSSFNITFTDPDGDSITFSSNNSRIAVSKINNSLATVSWKPTNLDLGSIAINLTASDGFLADSEIIAISVNITNNAASNFTTSEKAVAIINEQYSYDADAADADNDTIFFSLKSNASGMSINSETGLVTFNPSSAGFFSVNVSASDLTSITNQSFFLSSIYGTRLKISDIDAVIDGKKSSNIANGTQISKESKPGSKIELKITVKNEFTKSEDIDIGDIVVKTAIEEIDDEDDIELESNEFDLGPENDKTITLKFNIPLNVDDTAFDVLIGAIGDDENGDEQGQFFEISLEVEKEEHDLRISGFEIAPARISCKREAVIDLQITNVGAEDEENAALEIKGDFGILLDEKLSIDAGTDDNSYSKSINFEIDDADSGAYRVIAEVYTDEGKLQDTGAVDLSIEDCSFQRTEQEALMANSPKIQETISIKERIQAPTTEIKIKDDGNMLLLVLSTFIFAMFFVSAAIILFIKW